MFSPIRLIRPFSYHLKINRNNLFKSHISPNIAFSKRLKSGIPFINSTDHLKINRNNLFKSHISSNIAFSKRLKSGIPFINSTDFNNQDSKKYDDFNHEDSNILKLPSGPYFSLSDHGREIIDRCDSINDELRNGRLISKIHFVKLNDSFSFLEKLEKLVLLYQVFPIVKQAVSDRDFLQFNEFFDILNMYVDYGVNLDQLLSLFYKNHVPDIYFSKVKMLNIRIVNSHQMSKNLVNPMIIEMLGFEPAFFEFESFNFDDHYLDFYKNVFINIQHIKNLQEELTKENDLIIPSFLIESKKNKIPNKNIQFIEWLETDGHRQHEIDENLMSYAYGLSKLVYFNNSYGAFLKKEKFIIK